MRFEIPKPESQSVTIAKAKLIKSLSAALMIVNTIGIPAVLNVFPEAIKTEALAAIILIDLGAAIAGIDGAGKIASERRFRRTVYSGLGKVGPNSDQTETGVFLSPAQLERFKMIQPFIEAGIDSALKEAVVKQAVAAPEVQVPKGVAQVIEAADDMASASQKTLEEYMES